MVKPLGEPKGAAKAAASEKLGKDSESRALSRARAIGIWSPGDVKISARPIPEDGWYLCDGAAHDRVEDADLFDAIGTTYGVGDGTTTFNVPAAPGRAIVGAGQGGGLTERLLGAAFGVEAHALIDAELSVHTHPIDVVNNHRHTVFGNITGNTTATGSFNRVSNLQDTSGGGTQGLTSLDGAHDHGGNTGTRGQGLAHPNVQPSLAFNVFIKR